jgi:hypothetical protein
MKGLFIILGECFRSGNQYTRIRGLPESYDQQINACNSHIDFFKSIEKSIKIDVFIGSYHTPYNSELFSIYKHYLIGNLMYDKVIGLTNLFKNCIKKIHPNNYDFIFYFRIDLCFKPEMINAFRPKRQMILFPCICFIPYHKTEDEHPRVNDTMMFIHKKYFKYLHRMIISHDSWSHMINNMDLTYEDLGVMIQTYHDSDSYKDLNPLYYIVNREECKTWKCYDKIFSKYHFQDL